MVDISGRLREIKKMVDTGHYFMINRARQYGKITTLKALKRFLENEYVVIRMDFQGLGYASFETEQMFVRSFSMELLDYDDHLPKETESGLSSLVDGDSDKCTLQNLFRVLSRWCRISDRGIVLMIDEVDSAANNQVFMDFLAQLRRGYLDRDERPSFQSVILAGVYDVKNMKRKIRPESEHRSNSPWNIAADFDVDMSFSRKEIEGMLMDYETDYHTGMNLDRMAGLLFDYTSGYPYLVSRICKLIDEKVAESGRFKERAAAWTKEGFLEAVRMLLSEKNTLFKSLETKLADYPQLQKTLYSQLLGGESIVYNVFDEVIDMAIMFGFVRKKDGNIVVANRIFETLLYNYFLTSADAQNTLIFKAASNNKSQFIYNGRLDMDVVIDYLGEQFIVELKIWRGNSYNERGEKQLADYLDYFHIRKGYMLSYNFN